MINNIPVDCIHQHPGINVSRFWPKITYCLDSWTLIFEIIMMYHVTYYLLTSRTLYCAGAWGLMRTVLQFEAIRSFSFHYARREAVPVRNCDWKKWVSEWLIVSSNISKLKSMISSCFTVSGSQNAASLNTSKFCLQFF